MAPCSDNKVSSKCSAWTRMPARAVQRPRVVPVWIQSGVDCCLGLAAHLPLPSNKASTSSTKGQGCICGRSLHAAQWKGLLALPQHSWGEERQRSFSSAPQSSRLPRHRDTKNSGPQCWLCGYVQLYRTSLNFLSELVVYPTPVSPRR